MKFFSYSSFVKSMFSPRERTCAFCSSVIEKGTRHLFFNIGYFNYDFCFNCSDTFFKEFTKEFKILIKQGKKEISERTKFKYKQYSEEICEPCNNKLSCTISSVKPLSKICFDSRKSKPYRGKRNV